MGPVVGKFIWIICTTTKIPKGAASLRFAYGGVSACPHRSVHLREEMTKAELNGLKEQVSRTQDPIGLSTKVLHYLDETRNINISLAFKEIPLAMASLSLSLSLSRENLSCL